MKSKVVIINIILLAALIGLVEMVMRSGFFDNRPSRLTAPQEKNLRTQTDPKYAYEQFGRITFPPPPPEYQDQFDEKLKAYPNQVLNKNYPLGYFSKELRKEGNYHISGTINGTDIKVYDVTYKIDKFGRRVVENQNEKIAANKFVLAFGCSFTFGEGLNQGFDYPSQLAKKLDAQWKVYNFGDSGFGPNDVLDHLNSHPAEYLAGVDEPEGVFIWYFLQDHMTRFFCPWICYGPQHRWILPKTEYDFEDNKLVQKTSFEQSRDPERQIYNFLSKSAIIQKLGYRIYPYYTPRESDIFIKSLEQISNSLKNKRITKKYIVIYSKFSGYTQFKTLLLHYGFEPIEFFRIFDVVQIQNKGIPADGHPTSELNWYLSEVLKDRIQRDFQ